MESLCDGGLVVDHALPEARSALVVRESEVGLETHLTSVGADGEREWGLDLAGAVGKLAGESLALEQDLEEELGVEGERGLHTERTSQYG